MKAHIKMEKLQNLVILKSKNKKFHQHKLPISIKIIDINKIVVSNKVSSGEKAFKYLTGYKNGKKIKPLRIFSPKN